MILSHRRLRGSVRNYELTVKYVDRPLGFQPTEMRLPDALARSPDVVRDYFARWNLGVV